MTEAIKEIDKAGRLDRRKSATGQVWSKTGHNEEKEQAEQDDSVMISDEARNRSTGKHRKTILEHLAEPDD